MIAITQVSVLLNHISIIVRIFGSDPVDWGLIPGRIIPNTKKKVIDAALVNTQHYTATAKFDSWYCVIW